MSLALCMMSGYLTAVAFKDEDGARGIFAYFGAGACIIAAGIIRVKYGE